MAVHFNHFLASMLLLGASAALAADEPSADAAESHACELLRTELREVDQAEALFNARRAGPSHSLDSQVVCVLPLLGFDRRKDSAKTQDLHRPTDADLSTTVCLAPALGYTYLDAVKAKRAFSAWRQRLMSSPASKACGT